MSDTEGEGFTIKDKRSSKQSEEEVKASEESQKTEPSSNNEPSSQDAGAGQNFELNFSTFVLSLTSSAFYHLGDIPDPTTGQKQENLPAVKQTIDILIMLQEKTANNLNADEKKLLEQLIYELQVKYVAKKPK